MGVFRHIGSIMCYLGIHMYKMEISEYVSFNYRRKYSRCKCCDKIQTAVVRQERVYPFKTSDKFDVQEYKNKHNIK